MKTIKAALVVALAEIRKVRERVDAAVTVGMLKEAVNGLPELKQTVVEMQKKRPSKAPLGLKKGGAKINKDGHLILKYTDGSEEDVGEVVRPTMLVRHTAPAIGTGGGLDSRQVAQMIEDRMDYSAPEYLDDQVSDGDVLTFTFSAEVQKVWVELHEVGVDDEATARVRADGTAPDSDTGTLIHAGVPQPITVDTTVVKVLATTGKTVSVYGYRR